MKKTSQRSNRSDDLPEITPVADVEGSRSCVLYGLQGTGKTTLISTWPKPLLLLDTGDKGTDSIRDVKGIDVARVRSVEQIDATYWALKKGKLKYKSVAIDTMTQVQSLVIEDILGKKEQIGFGTLSRKQFAEVSATMKRIITDYRDLEDDRDINIAFLCQQRFFKGAEEDEDGGNDQAEIGPALMPSIATVLNADVSIIAQTFIRNKVEKKKDGNKIKTKHRTEFCLRVGPDSLVRTKIRKPKSMVPPSFLIDPTYEDLIELISGD